MHSLAYYEYYGYLLTHNTPDYTYIFTSLYYLFIHNFFYNILFVFKHKLVIYTYNQLNNF